MTIRRKRLTAEDRRKLILRSAIALFSERGFRATRVKDLAERVGTSDALVFQHFPTKRELYEALMEELCGRRHFTDVEEILYYAPTYDVADVLTRLSVWVLQEAETEPAWLRLILYAALEQDETVPRLMQEHFQRLIDYIAYEIDEGQKAGHYKTGDPRLYARDFIAGLLGLSLIRTVARDPAYRSDPIPASASAHVAVFLHGLEVRPTRDRTGDRLKPPDPSPPEMTSTTQTQGDEP